jgi:hypothetical protein
MLKFNAKLLLQNFIACLTESYNAPFRMDGLLTTFRSLSYNIHRP